MASNPEFLKEGAAIDDFMKPDRVVVGVRAAGSGGRAAQTCIAPFLRTEKPFLVMSPESAEMTKYVANALLATKISFINEVANLCERMAADIDDVRRGIGHDSRIGFAFLFPGVGYGGSCFPKDVQALAAMAREHGVRAAACSKRCMKSTSGKRRCCGEKIAQHFGGKLAGPDDRHLGPGVQAAHRRHPRGAGAGADRPAAGAGGEAAGSRSRGDGERPPPVRRQAALLPRCRWMRSTGPTRWRS